MDRRSFFRSMGLAGALISTAQLPALAQDDATVFPQRGGYERLVLGYAVIEIGLDTPFSVLHISDTHLTAAYPEEDEKKQELHRIRTTTFGGRQEEALRDSLAWAKEHVDYVIHTGDLIDWQSEANFALVKQYFGEAMTGSLGNHEYSTDMWLSDPKESRDEAYKANTKERVQKVYPFDVQFHSQVVNGVNFITLDDVYGYVTPEQVERFHEEVKRGLPIILCMHVPFISENIWRATCRFWKSGKKPFREKEVPQPTDDYLTQLEDPVTRDFIAYLKQEPLLKGILAGHEHFTMQDRFSPTAIQYIVGSNFLFHGQEILFL